MNGILAIGTALGLVLTAVFLIAGTAAPFLTEPRKARR
ncbi:MULTISPECIES: cell wall metabolism sensor histidine kinase WalK [Glycomyces]|uniref:Uncharacterized protein n=1 Tax=Glycomyces artemisiae TaxID=1076443 RepID=A0A2T0UMI0_9ACTN|nr:cell wall metabolism sensor histidine kinase WalK [Glycomyces artemisiae]PRY59135.1 hypothetical protein B0I28_104292 [Glycomyces artemisiae]